MASESDSTPSSSRGSMHQVTANIPMAKTYTSSTAHYMSAPSPMSPGSYEKESRKISSVIISEELVEPARDLEPRTIEREVYEPRTTYKAKKEVVYVETRVPKVEIQYQDKIVEFEQKVYVDNVVEVPEYREVIVHKPKIEVVDREVERVIHNPIVTVVKREERVEVPGKIIEVPKHYKVEQKIEIPQYVDGDVPVIVAQTVKPVLLESAEAMDVDVVEYEPEVVAVDIHVAKAVDANLISSGAVHQVHRVVTVPAGQYNMLMRQLNTHLNDKEVAALPFMQENGQIPFLRDPVVFEVAKVPLQIEGYNARAVSRRNSSVHPAPFHVARDVSSLVTSDRQSTFKSTPKTKQHQHQSGCCSGPTHSPKHQEKPVVVYRSATTNSSVSSSEIHAASVAHQHPQPYHPQPVHPKGHAPTVHSELGTARTHSTAQVRTVTGHTTQSGRRSLPSAVGKSKGGCC